MTKARRRDALATLIASLLLAAGCVGPTGAKSTQQTAANVYGSKLIGLTVVKPNGWYALNERQRDALLDTGSRVAAGDDKDLKRALEASKPRTIGLFNFFMFAPGTPVSINPGVAGLAEDVSALPGIKTGKDYFYFVKRMMAHSKVDFTFGDGYKERRIGGVTFDEMDVTLTFEGVSHRQAYYSARHGDYVVTIIESYDSPMFKEASDKVIDSIKLDW